MAGLLGACVSTSRLSARNLERLAGRPTGGWQWLGAQQPVNAQLGPDGCAITRRWRTRRRAINRSRARHARRGSTFWMNVIGSKHVGLYCHGASLDSSSTSSGSRPGYETLHDVATQVDSDGSLTSAGSDSDVPSVCPSAELTGDESCEDGRSADHVSSLFGTGGSDIFRGLPSGGRIRLGSDCCGLCTFYVALQAQGREVDFRFACDSNLAVKRMALERYPIQVWYDDVMTRDSSAESVPVVDLYTAGFPCQPFSTSGKRLGMADHRGTVFDGCAQYISCKRPTCFVLENVRGLLSHAGGATFAYILATLREIGQGCYDVCHWVLNAEDYGIPQHRPRLFIIGRLRAECNSPLMEPVCRAPLPLNSFLDRPASGDKTVTTGHIGGLLARSNIETCLQQIRDRGDDPSEVCYIFDIDASPGWISLMKNRCPCLLASRPHGYYVSTLDRRLSLAERFRLQGFTPFGCKSVSTLALGAMVGNSMNVMVVQAILSVLIPSIDRFRADPCSDFRLTGMSLQVLLDSWSRRVLNSKCGFGNFARDFLGGRCAHVQGRCANILPLPVVTGDLVARHDTGLCKVVHLRLFNLLVAGLNYMYRGNRGGDVPAKATGLHRTVLRALQVKLDRGIEELQGADRTCCFDGAVGRLCGVLDVEKFPSLRVDDVDVLPSAAQVDPLPLLTRSAQHALQTVGLLFPHGTVQAPSRRRDREKHFGDRVSLTLRMLRSGKLVLSQSAEASADTFVVGKPGGERLREIWNGAIISEAALPPPKPPLQACPASLTTLEASADRPLWMTTRDGKVFFDQLKVPDGLRRHLGRPVISIADLVDPPPCESGGRVETGMTQSELESWIVDGPLVCGCQDLVPLNNTFPMGFAWSSFVAQSVMVKCCVRSGFKSSQLLSSERALVQDSLPVVAVATDDINLFERFSIPERRAAGNQRSPLSRLDATWEDLGIQGHPEKATERLQNGKVLGIQLRDGTRLQARGDRVWNLLEASGELSSSRRATPLHISGLCGHLHWQNLLNRPLFSCLHSVYEFAQAEPQQQERFVSGSVLSEVLLNVSLFALWSADLTKPWWSFIAATDASPAYGYGLCVAPCSPLQTREVGAFAADSSAVIRLADCADGEEVPRAGPELRLNLGMDDFEPVFAVRATAIAHAGQMELEAVKLAVLRLTRSPRNHAHRGVLLVDAQAVGHALRKGRSSAASFRFGIAAVAALSLAADIKLSYPYLPSESNPADYPSRGLVRRRTDKKKGGVRRRSSLDMLERRCRKLRRVLRAPARTGW